VQQKREYKVLAPIPKANGGEWFMNVGRAYDNVDGSVNLYIDALPTHGTKGLKLQLRQLDEEDLRRRERPRVERHDPPPQRRPRVRRRRGAVRSPP
jgi:hypothetical protein